MASQTFELVSPFMSIYAPARTIADSTLLNGKTTNALVPGELLVMDGSYQVKRPLDVVTKFGTDADNADEVSRAPGFVFFSETGRGDIVTGGKVPVLQFGPYEADTSVFARSSAGILQTNNYTGALGANDIGKAVGIFAVRNPNSYASADPGAAGAAHNDNHIVAGLGVLSAAQLSGNAYRVGYISRIIGAGTSMKVRILFGI